MYLWSLRLDFACTCQRAVDFTHICGEDSADDGNVLFCALLDGSDVISFADGREGG